MREKIDILFIFSHPDFTVGAGISPARLFYELADFYRRYGISPFPKEITLFILFRRKTAFTIIFHIVKAEILFNLGVSKLY